MVLTGHKHLCEMIDDFEHLEENISNFVVIIVSADGLALLGARMSAGTMTNFGSHIYMYSGLTL